MTPTVLPQFPSTGPKLMSCPCWYTRNAFLVPTASFCPFGTPEARLLYQHISYFIWYTRSAFPVPTHLLFHLVHQKRVSCTNTSLISFGTPEARFLYQHISYFIWYTRSASPVPTHLLFHLVHQKHVSCTNGAPQYIRCIQRPHHVHFLFYGTIGDPSFQV